MEAAKELWRAVIDVSTDCLVITNSTQIIIGFNRKTETTFGLSRSNLIGNSLTQVLPESTHWNLSLSPPQQTYTEIICAEGLRRQIWVTATSVTVASETFYCFRLLENLPFESEITGQKDATVTKLRSDLFRVQDEEKRKFSRELHDNLGQVLGALSMNLSVVQTNLTGDVEKASVFLTESRDLVDRCIREIRTFSFLLHPPLMNSELDFHHQLLSYIEGFSRRSSIVVETDIPQDLPSFASQLQVVLFRVLQESLSNIYRHSREHTSKVTVRHEGGAIRISIQDFGHTPRNADWQRNYQTGIGITGMQERVAAFAGTISVDPTKNGTLVSAVLPLSAGKG